MGKENITSGNIEVEKHKFHHCKNPISIYIVKIDRIVVSNKFPFGKKGFKYFIGYEHDHKKVMPLCIMPPKMSAYIRDFNETKYISLLIKDNELLEKYNKICDKVSKVI